MLYQKDQSSHHCQTPSSISPCCASQGQQPLLGQNHQLLYNRWHSCCGHFSQPLQSSQARTCFQGGVALIFRHDEHGVGDSDCGYWAPVSSLRWAWSCRVPSDHWIRWVSCPILTLPIKHLSNSWPKANDIFLETWYLFKVHILLSRQN